MARLLLVDADAPPSLALRTALAEAHHEVRVARTAGEAVAACAGLPPELVVLEPLVDPRPLEAGLCGELAALVPGVPLVVLTAADERLAPEARRRQDHDRGWLPVDLYLQKPVAPELVVEQVAQLLGGGH